MLPFFNDFFYEIGVSSYDVFLILAVVVAVVCFCILSRRGRLEKGAFNFYLLGGVLAIFAGLGSAFLFQAVYNFAESGVFEFVGMTVMGGILGAAVFFVIYALVGTRFKLFAQCKSSFWDAVNLMIPCVVIAHCIGRVGCFTAGCCYGRETSGWLGVTFVRGFTPSGTPVYHSHPRLPTQLFEAGFLLTLFAAMLIVLLIFRKKNLSCLIYLYAYPIFRFLIEFLRDDERGAQLLGLTPSQVQSLGLLVVAIALTVLIYGFRIVPFCRENSKSGTADIKGATAESESVPPDDGDSN